MFAEKMSSGIDFDDPEYGFKEEDKDPVKVLISAQSLMRSATND